MVPGMDFLPLAFEEHAPEEMAKRARLFRQSLQGRRTIRDFASREIPEGILEDCLAAAHSAPSGANLQPWHFAVVRNPATKRRIREAAEDEEHTFYQERAPEEWLEALKPFGTDWRKPFLETAPWLVVVFEQRFGINQDGSRRHNFYVKESVGLACGIFVATLHRLGLATLTHTPSPMAFLTEVLDRPSNERPFILFPVGYPAPTCLVPNLIRKPLDEVMVVIDAAPAPD